MAAIKLKSIPLNGTNKNAHIRKGKLYLVVSNSELYLGRFNKEWYGWNFEGVYDAGEQLDSIEKVYEIENWKNLL